VINRVHALDGGPPEADVEALAAALGGDAKLAAKVARAYAEERALAERDDAAIEHLCQETGERNPIVIPQLDGDVHDVDGLVAIHGHLFAD
jgi:predicted trehalose synthase